MTRITRTAALLAALLLAGCSSTPSKDGGDPKRAADLNAQLGVRYMVQGNQERAMEKLNYALTFDPDHGPAHHYLGELYRRLGRDDDAERHFRRALVRMPDDANLHNNMGVFLCGRGRYDEAEKEFLRVLEHPVYQPRDEVYENLGLCMQRKPDIAKADQYLRQALSINPRLPKSLFTMAQLSHADGNMLSARAYLQRYSEVARHTPETLWLGIQIERVLGDRDALASYELLLRNNFSASEQARLYQESLKR
jgi:type IV pilus assembly protein PilF